jgi:putative ABC transport system permease protein
MTDDERNAKPPRAAEAVLRAIVLTGRDAAAEGELREGFDARRRGQGNRGARRWYWRQVRGYAWRAISVRRSEASGGKARMRANEAMTRLADLRRDAGWAVRSQRRRPGFTIVAVMTLALGIGANSAILTLVGAHFFQSLPYEAPDELVLLWETGRNTQEVRTVAPGNYWSWREEATSFVDIAAYNVDFATLSGMGGAERVTASVVVPHFFDVLGAEPLLGTGFDEASVRTDGLLQVVLSHSLWTRRYGADPSIVGRDVRIDGRPYTVLGVMPAVFRQPERSLSWQTTELWRPMLLDAERDDFGSRYLRTIARRRTSLTVEQSRREMNALAQRLRERHPEANAGRGVIVRTVDDYLLADARPTLLMLLFAGGAVLLIVCANVANLTLARGEERRREFALRAALGSGGSRLVRQIVVEGLVLALLGAAVGTMGVFAARGVLQSIQASFFSGLIDVVVDARVVGLTTALAVGAGTLFALPLARTASRPDLARVLVEGTQRGDGGRTNRTRSALIVGQVGVATTLLVVAALLSRSFSTLIDVPPGFESEGVVTFTVSPPRATYEGRADLMRYHRDLLAAVEMIPGVSGVGMVSDLMFTNENRSMRFSIDGRETDPRDPLSSEFHVVIPEYFDVLDIPVRGGTLPERWAEGDEVPIVLNERMAAMYWPSGDALGAGLSVEMGTSRHLRVVAIVGDVLDDGYAAVADPTFYTSFSLMPTRAMTYVVRSAGDPGPIMSALREAVGALDADIPAGNLRTLESMMDETVARPRAASLIGMTFALVALLVSATGIYGVLSYSVQRRTREIGIRAALGAGGPTLVSMVLGQSARLVATGLVLGVLGAVGAGGLLSDLLFGVKSWDPISLSGAVGVLGAVAMLAAWLPARRAVRVDPREALRAE